MLPSLQPATWLQQATQLLVLPAKLLRQGPQGGGGRWVIHQRQHVQSQLKETEWLYCTPGCCVGAAARHQQTLSLRVQATGLTSRRLVVTQVLLQWLKTLRLPSLLLGALVGQRKLGPQMLCSELQQLQQHLMGRGQLLV